MCFVDKET